MYLDNLQHYLNKNTYTSHECLHNVSIKVLQILFLQNNLKHVPNLLEKCMD